MNTLLAICAFGTIASTIASSANLTRSTAVNQQQHDSHHRYSVLAGMRFDYTGAVQQYVTPAGSTGMIKFTLYGASGGDPLENYGFYGGRGAVMQGILNIAAGTTLQIYVGGQGTSTIGGFNGGGTAIGISGYSFGGGGATDIRVPPYSLNDRVLVAGGGGGASGNCGTHGGTGGYPSGFAGPTCSVYQSGGGGTYNAGGNWADDNPPQGYCTDGANRGTFGQGGKSCARDQGGSPFSYGGAGGGGWFGGGGAFGAGGGGGSSYATVTPTYVSSEGVLSGHGYVLIELLMPTAAPTISPSLGPPSAAPTSFSPTKNPTLNPTLTPSQDPSQQPTRSPSIQPSAQPSVPPTVKPSALPSSQPSDQPSSQPSTQPSASPTAQPSSFPSSFPSAQPSVQPSSVPSALPTCQPSAQPSSLPSVMPSAVPSSQPSQQPSAQPSMIPSVQPSVQPSSAPSVQPTAQPTDQPSNLPTGLPTVGPSTQPTVQPSVQPSSLPSSQPSVQPSTNPSSQPSALPTSQPSGQPSSWPSTLPSVQPSEQPSVQPTSIPTAQPSVQPSSLPSTQPSLQPTIQPSEQPTTRPTALPSAQPSLQPSSFPSAQPTELPSTQPSAEPSAQPSNIPTTQPSMQPTTLPSLQPSVQPSLQPSAQPSSQPTSTSTSQPSAQPSEQPSSLPSGSPSMQPTSRPTAQPSSLPSTRPSTQPSSHPSKPGTRAPSPLPTLAPSAGPTMKPSLQPSADPTMGPSRAGVQVFFNGTQTLRGLNSTEFINNHVIVTAWKAAVAAASALDKSSLVRVDITSLEDATSRRLTTHESTSLPIVFGLNLAVIVGFKVSYTLEDFESTNPDVTTQTLKDNYALSVAKNLFTPILASEIQQRTTESEALIAKIVPAEVVFGKAYVILYTTYSPTAAPTYSPVAPVIYTITSAYTSTSIHLDLTFTQGALYPGQVYCAVFAANTTTVAVDQIITASDNANDQSGSSSGSSSGNVVSYLSSDTAVQLTIANLLALTHYVTFCYVETAQGTGNTHSEVLNTRREHNTECCKSMTFTNAPTVLYGNVDKYGSAQSKQFVFTYTLSAAPSATVEVTPVFNTTAGLSMEGTISTLPARVIFTPTSHLTASFIISINESRFTTNDYLLTLSATGHSGVEYLPTTHNVRILSSDEPPPPPRLLSATFSRNGGAISVLFDSPTSQSSSTVLCDSLFAFNGASVAACAWTSNSALTITFPAYNDSIRFAEPGDYITLPAHTFTAACSANTNCTAFGFNTEQNVTFSAPTQPTPPNVVILLPSKVAYCENITIDASSSSGHGGRPWKNVHWTVRTNTASTLTNTTQLEQLLNRAGRSLTQSVYLSAAEYFSMGVEYTITMYATNFLGVSSSASVQFSLSTNPNMPTVQILGPSTRTYTPAGTITLYSTSLKSSCAERNAKFSSLWHIFDSNNTLVNVLSSSKDGAVLIVDAGLLHLGVRYRVEVTTTAEATAANSAIDGSALAYVSIVSGKVIAKVRGGERRLVWPEDTLVVDASESYDENTGASRNSTGLQFAWSCLYLTNTRYGASCDDILVASTTTSSIVSIIGAALTLVDTYSVQVFVTAADGRSGVKATVLQVQNSISSTSASMTHYPTKVNAENRLIIAGYVSAQYNLTASWSASINGVDFPLITQTPQVVLFNHKEVHQGIPYTLLVPGGALSAGSSVTFRIFADRTVSGSTSILSSGNVDLYAGYSEITIEINAPPTSGTFVTTPSAGTALTTLFRLAATGWTDHYSDLPLMYAFFCVTAPSTDKLTLQSRQGASAAHTVLPASRVTDVDNILVIASIYDTMLAYSEVNRSVSVYPVTTEALDLYIQDSLNTFETTQNTDQAGLLINNVLSTISPVSCQSANSSYCASLNRYPCSNTPHTCSSCLDGYTGVSGHANTQCALVTMNSRPVGSNCTSNSDCSLANCVSNICTAPVKQCPSAVSNAECSGNGICAYTDSSGKAMPSCTVLQTQCSATCRCYTGYSGSDCSYTAAEVQSIAVAREVMSEVFLQVDALSNPSTAYLSSAANTLSLLVDTTMSVSNSTETLYYQAISSVAQLAAQGYLADAPASTVQILLDLVGRSAKLSNTNKTSITASLNQISEGVLTSMVKGQLDTSVATDNIKFTASKNRTSVLSAFSSPSTAAESLYGIQGTSSVEIADPTKTSVCDSGEGYVEMSLTQWGRNPYSDNFNDTSADAFIAAPQIRLQSIVPADSALRRTSSRNDVVSDDTVAYFVTLQFNQAHNFSKVSDANTTFPECTVYNEQTRAYQSCNSCNVSSYTSTYVTFACYDISKLCNSGSNTESRNMYSENPYYSSNSHRKLTDDDYLESALGLGEQSSLTSIQYTALVTTFISILSQNPANINFAAAKVIISIVIGLFGTIAIGFVFFHRWDVYDHNIFLYKHKEPPHLRKKVKPEQKLRAQTSSFFGSLYGSMYGSFYGTGSENEHIGAHNVNQQDHSSQARKMLEENSEKTMPPTPDVPMQKKSYFGSFFGPMVPGAGNEAAEVTLSLPPKPKKVTGVGNKKPSMLLKDPTRESFYAADNTSQIKNKKKAVPTVFTFPSVYDIYEANDSVTNDHADGNSAYGRIGYDKSNYGSFYDTQDNVFSTVIDDYLEMVIPIDNIDGSHTSAYTKLMNIITAHPISTLFFEPSLQVNRVQRWTMLWLGMMCGMFVDTLFFSSFFPVADECASYFTESDCLVPQNDGLKSNLCVWSAEDNICAPAEPPSDMMFVMILVMVTLVICVPITFVFDYVMSEVCAKRPDFSQWGYNNDAILGTSTQKLAEFNTAKLLSPIVALRLEIESARAALGASSRFHTDTFKQNDHKSTAERALDDVDAGARIVYDEYIGVDEEVTHILHEAIQYVTGTLCNQQIPWHNATSSPPTSTLFTNTITADRLDKVHAIEEYLGVFADGTPVPLTVLQYLQYGTARDMLVSKIELAREQQEEIRDTIEGLGDNELLSKDQALTQFFILEQFSSFKQYALRSQLFSFSVTTALMVDPGHWLCGWVFLIACLLFFLYWTLMWGITTTNATITAWGINFAIAAAQDLFLIQTFRLFVLYMIANICIKPQLTAIYRTLQRLAIEYVQDELPDAFGVIKVVQHLSPACRVASMKVSDNLAAGQILRHIDDRDIHNFRTASDIKLPLIFLSVVAIPVLIGVLSEASGDIALDTVLPSAFSMFILAHYMAWALSPMLVIIPYIAVFLWVLFRRPLYGSAERRLQARESRRREAKLDTDSWRTRRGTPTDSFGSVTETTFMYCAAQYRQWSTGCMDTLALVAVCIGRKGSGFFPSASAQRDESLHQWQKLNIPLSLQGKVVESFAVSMQNKKEILSVPVMPERIQRLTKDASVRWDLEEGPPDEGDSPGPDYFLSLLGLGDMYLLQPSVPSAEERSAPFGSVLHVGRQTPSRRYKRRSAAARFRNEHSFPASSKAAIVRAITSYREQMQAGKLYYLSLYDEQLLTAAENDKQLLRYAGLVHVRDLACMLEEILYFYRPEGQMLSEKQMKTVFVAYDEWIQENAKPLSQDVLSAISQLLIIQGHKAGQHGGASITSCVDATSNVGFFEEHKLVAAVRQMHIMAEEIHDVNVHMDMRNSSKNSRECVRWSDIRCLLDRTQPSDASRTSRQTSLRLAPMSPIALGSAKAGSVKAGSMKAGSIKAGSMKAGTPKVGVAGTPKFGTPMAGTPRVGSAKYPVIQSIAARASLKRQRTEKLGISHSVAPFDAFARWLYYVLKDLQVEHERGERKALRLEMSLLQDQLEESKYGDAYSIGVQYDNYFPDTCE